MKIKTGTQYPNLLSNFLEQKSIFSSTSELGTLESYYSKSQQFRKSTVELSDKTLGENRPLLVTIPMGVSGTTSKRLFRAWKRLSLIFSLKLKYKPSAHTVILTSTVTKAHKHVPRLVTVPTDASIISKPISEAVKIESKPTNIPITKILYFSLGILSVILGIIFNIYFF